MTYNLQFKALALIALLFIGCSKSDDTVNLESEISQSEVKLKFDEEFAFTLSNATSVQWESSDPFVGTIDSNGKFTAKHIGETTITGRSSGRSVTAKVIVEPYVTDIIEPFLTFGANKAAVKSFEKRTLRTEVADGLVYVAQRTKVREVLYAFENGRLYASRLYFNISMLATNDLARFYFERYIGIDLDDRDYLFVTKDAKTGVILSFSSSTSITATYVDGSDIQARAKTSSKSNKRSQITVQSLIEDIERI